MSRRYLVICIFIPFFVIKGPSSIAIGMCFGVSHSGILLNVICSFFLRWKALVLLLSGMCFGLSHSGIWLNVILFRFSAMKGSSFIAEWCVFWTDVYLGLQWHLQGLRFDPSLLNRRPIVVCVPALVGGEIGHVYSYFLIVLNVKRL